MNWTLHVTTILDQLSNVKTIHRRVKIEALQCLKLRLRCTDALIVFPWDNILWKVTYHIFYDCGVWKWITCVCGPKKHSSGQQSLVTRLSIELWHLVQRWRHFQPARKLDTKSIWRWQKAGQHISVGLPSPSSMLRIHTRQARLDKGGSTGSIFRLHHLQSDIWGQIW